MSDLERFVRAQDGGVYERALRELAAGRKQTHWIWFVLPQPAGLGHSEMSRRYAIADLDEARAYLAHPVLGPRLVECCRAVLASGVEDPVAIMGDLDARKLRSCMTLFAEVAADPSPFTAVLERLFVR